MGFISSISSELRVSFTFYSKNVSVVNGVEQPETGTLSKTVDGLFWTGTQNLSFISDKLKTQVEGTIAIDYDATITALADDSWFIANSKKYRILHIDDVGEQNEMLKIFYKREVSN